MARHVKILGRERLKRKLLALPQAAKDEIRKALEKSADEIVALARSLVPVLSDYDARRRPGALRDSIGWTWGRAPRGAITLGKVSTENPSNDLTITIYAGNDEAFYARWVEFGTQQVGVREAHRDKRYKTRIVMTKRLRAHAGTRAQPFFYPAYRANRRRARSRVTRSINKAAKKVAAGL